MQYATANKLTYTAIEELETTTDPLPLSKCFADNLYRFKKFFQQYNSGFEQQRVCFKCFKLLAKGEVCDACSDVDNPVRCPEMSGPLVYTPFQKPLQTVLSSEFSPITLDSSLSPFPPSITVSHSLFSPPSLSYTISPALSAPQAPPFPLVCMYM